MPGTAGEGRNKRQQAGSRRPTIRDVSQLAGVSRMTVSRVISDPELVLPATRDKVNKAIADLGYVPDRAAGSLSTRKTGFIALMLPTLTNSNFAAVAHGLTEALRAADFQLLIAYTEYDMAEEERQLRALLARRPEAIILTGSTHSREATKLLYVGDVPVVEIADLPSNPIQHVIGFSNQEVGRAAARYLLGLGLTKIAAIGGRVDGPVIDHRGEERMRGFEDELKLAGVSTERVFRYGKAPLSHDHGSQAIGALLEQFPDTEGVFAVSDLSAVGVVMELQRRGISVPDDIAVMGFGNFEIGRIMNPPLTTIHVDFTSLGRQAGEVLIELLSGESEDSAPRRIDVGLEIIERESTKREPKRTS